MDPIVKERWEATRDTFDRVAEKWVMRCCQMPLSFKDTTPEAMDEFYDAVDGMFKKVFFNDDTPLKLTWSLLSEEDLSTIDGFCGPNGYTIFRAWCARHNIECK